MLFSSLADYRNAQDDKYEGGSFTKSPNSYIELAIEYMKQNYQDGINVADVAGYVGISRAYLNQIFQKEFGFSVQKFLIDFRMHKAANMLVSSVHSVREVSQSVGYEDQFVFSKAFKKKFGISPKNYRINKVKTIQYSEKQLADHEEDFAD